MDARINILCVFTIYYNTNIIDHGPLSLSSSFTLLDLAFWKEGKGRERRAHKLTLQMKQDLFTLHNFSLYSHVPEGVLHVCALNTKMEIGMSEQSKNVDTLYNTLHT